MQVSVNDYYFAGAHIPGYTWDDRPVDQLPQGLRIVPAFVVQAVQNARASSTDFEDRFNDTTTISFRVMRGHRTLEQAEVFMMFHRLDLPRVGQIRLFAQNSVGGASSIGFIKKAVVSITDSNQTGLVTVHAYQIQGGKLTRTET